MSNYGFENVVECEEYFARRPYLINKTPKMKEIQEIIPKENIHREEPIEAIFVLQTPNDWFAGLQICIDINGQVGKHFDYKRFEDYHVPIFIANPDLEYSNTFYTPRLTAGAFGACVQAIFERKTGGQKLKNLVFCGKPMKYPFEYVENHLKKQKRFYMIGDNPKSDIMGANSREKWFSVLVRTGCHQLSGNDPDYPGDVVCNDLLESVKFILEREKMVAKNGGEE